MVLINNVKIVMQIVKARKVKNLKPIIQVKMYVYDNRLKF